METSFAWDVCRDLGRHPPYPLTLPSTLMMKFFATDVWLSESDSPAAKSYLKFFLFLSDRNIPIPVATR